MTRMKTSAERQADELDSSHDRTRRACDDSQQRVAGQAPLPTQVAFLQRSIGNAATARLLASARTGSLAVQRNGDGNATGTKEDIATLGYKAITDAVGQNRLKYKNIEVQPNGALFVEFRQTNPRSDRVASQMQNSWDEKLHVPANLDDIATRTNIVTQLCLEMGFTAFKTTRPEKLQNVKPGAPMAWQMLKDAKLADDEAYDANREIHEYLNDALLEEKRDALLVLLNKHPPVPPDRQGYGGALAAIADSVVADSGVFPSEQRGREITIYIDPGFKPDEWWANFAKTLVARMESAGLPRLPIADGDQPVRGEGALVDGAFHAYFSSRDEAMAMDTVLDDRGFPGWYGSNAKKSRAAGQKLIFDMDLDDPGLNVNVDAEDDETTVHAQVAPGKLQMFTDWLTKVFGSFW
jgi:hypothetical protein